MGLRLPLLFACLSVLGGSQPVHGQSKQAVGPRRSPGDPSTPPGNILVLIADDLGVDQLAAYGVGSDLPPTPNLDRMAAEGVLFRNVWSQPTCSPTRATIQTGRYGFRTTIGMAINAFGGGPALPLDAPIPT